MPAPYSDETPIDPSHLLIKWDGSRHSLNQAEAENILVPTLRYFAGPISPADAPFTFDWMKGLHREMFCRVWAWAGNTRTHNVNIGVDFYEVESRLWSLAADIGYWVTPPEKVIEDAAEIHHRAVQIHPFPNGNGRWSRLLANIWLHRHGLPPTEWPEESMSVINLLRSEYIKALKMADGGNRKELVELHRRYTQSGSAR